MAQKEQECGLDEKQSTQYQKALSDGEKLREFLSPYAGLWIALSADWTRVLVHDSDRLTCISKAKEHAERGEVPCFFRVPADAA